jgi:hypothetical protein
LRPRLDVAECAFAHVQVLEGERANYEPCAIAIQCLRILVTARGHSYNVEKNSLAPGGNLSLLFLLTLQSRWSKLRNIVQWPPFTQTYKNRRYQWVQLAGHSGNFKAGHDQGTVLKKFCPQEELCYNQFVNDALAEFVPHYLGTLEVHSADNDETESEFRAMKNGLLQSQSKAPRGQSARFLAFRGPRLRKTIYAAVTERCKSTQSLHVNPHRGN